MNKRDYTPNKNHPWKRSYKVNLTQQQREPKEYKKTFQEFVSGFISNWDNLEVYEEGDYIKRRLTTLPQAKQALWLISVIKKVYLNYE